MILAGLYLSLTPLEDGKKLIQDATFLIKDVVINFGKQSYGNVGQTVRERSLIVRMVRSNVGKCASTERICNVAGSNDVTMASTSNSPSPKISVTIKPLVVYFF